MYAGNPNEVWYKGSVVLSNQQVVVGDISVYPTHHLIMFRTQEGTTVLPASKLESFFFYDAAANVNRKFISRTDQESILHQHQLYELVLTGAIPVLRKQVLSSEGSDDADDFNYFVLFENALIELRKFKRQVYPKIIRESEELLAFVKGNNLDPAKPGNAVKIIRQYNTQSLPHALAMN